MYVVLLSGLCNRQETCGVIIYIKHGQLSYFRAKARNTPNEIYACLIGKHIGGASSSIYYIAYPKLDLSKPCIVVADLQDIEQIDSDAASQGLSVVGNIHSHPDFVTELSPHDHKTLFIGKEKIVGVVGIVQRRTFVTFWQRESSLPCKVEYI